MSEVADIARLQALLQLSPPPPVRRTLMEALGFLHYENPHSDFLAWLLDPRSSTEGTPLLHALLKHARVEVELGEPEAVEREVAAGGDRADIVVSWPDFTLVIENKVWSHEGNGQCARYLASFKIENPAVGRLLFLDLRGRWPASVTTGDPRVVVLSYLDLLAILEGTAVSDARTRVLMEEYAASLAQLTARRTVMEKPQMSSSTREYIAAQAALGRMAQAAHQESESFIRWVVQVLEEKLQNLLGDDLVCDETFGCAWLFRRKGWARGGLGYGVAYSAEARPGRRLLPDYPHLVGVRVQPIEGADVTADQPALTTELVGWLRQHWSNEIMMSDEKVLASQSNLRNDNQWWAWYASMPPSADEDWDRWSDRVVSAVVRSVEKLAAPLDAFASRSGT